MSGGVHFCQDSFSIVWMVSIVSGQVEYCPDCFITHDFLHIFFYFTREMMFICHERWFPYFMFCKRRLRGLAPAHRYITFRFSSILKLRFFTELDNIQLRYIYNNILIFHQFQNLDFSPNLTISSYSPSSLAIKYRFILLASIRLSTKVTFNHFDRLLTGPSICWSGSKICNMMNLKGFQH